MAPPRRIVVVSPHLDDGVLSLGASMASWAGKGDRVELLTVFACDPESDAPAGGWDSRGGYATEGESARARREEDAKASAILGIEPVWLPFGSVDYERHANEDEVRAAVAEATRGADEILVPGFPLTHPDHAWLAGIVEGTARYLELLYARREGADRPPGYEPLAIDARDRLAKWRAIRAYRSQLPLLGMRRSLRRGPLALALAREAVQPRL